jgi:hypothetical protein
MKTATNHIIKFKIVFLLFNFFSLDLKAQLNSIIEDSIFNVIQQNQTQQLFPDSIAFKTDQSFAGLQLIYPSNAGISLRFGSIPKIEWNVESGVSSVKIEYTTNGGTDWITITNSTVNDGSYLWETMPNVSTINAKIRITDVSSPESDESANNFTIISISPNFPNITTSPVKILPLGNSITFDQNNKLDFPNPRSLDDRKSYRYPLYSLLTGSNYNFDMVGGEAAGSNYFDDFQSASWPGINAEQIHSILVNGNNTFTKAQETPGSQSYLTYYESDVILLHAGTNPPQDPTKIEAILNAIDSYSSDTWVIVALIINYKSPGPTISNYNDSVRTLVNDRINNLSDKIILVNMEDKLISSDFEDDFHPNSSGYDKMANVWYGALQVLLGTPADYSPIIKSDPITHGVVGINYKYDVSATGKSTTPTTFSLLQSPANMQINSTTGLIEWTPSSTGNFNVTVSATNGINPNATQSFTINVVKYPNDMIHYWKLEEEFGLPYKDHYGTNDGTETRYPPSSVAGIVGKALDFDRSEQINFTSLTGNRVTVRDDDSFDWGASSSFSIECWIKRDVIPNQTEEVIIGRGLDSQAPNWRVSVTSDSRVKFVLQANAGGGSLTISTSANTINIDTFYHVAAVRNHISGTNKIYVNGSEVISGAVAYTQNFVSDLPITIGSLRNSSTNDRDVVYRFDGLIDEVALYNKALSPSEIAQHYYNGNINGIGYEEQKILADITVLLQGPYISSAPPYMSTALNSGGHLPQTQPYNGSPWNYTTGTEAVSTNFFANNPTIVDWVLVELRDKNNPASILATRAGFLKSDGKVVDIDGVSKLGFDITPDAYYITVKHRNHLAVMCSDSARAFFSAPSVTAYDFTDNQSKAYTPPSGPAPMATLSGGKFGMYGGDCDGSGFIDVDDFTGPDNERFQSGYKNSDSEMSGFVDVDDFTLPDNNKFKGSQVP